MALLLAPLFLWDNAMIRLNLKWDRTPNRDVIKATSLLIRYIHMGTVLLDLFVRVCAYCTFNAISQLRNAFSFTDIVSKHPLKNREHGHTSESPAFQQTVRL